MFEEEYDSYEAIPDAVKHLYKQSGEKYVLVGPGEFKTVEDVQRVQEGLRKEREDHKATKRKLARFGDMEPDDVLEKLDRIEELEAAASGKIDETKLNELVETRLRSKTAPLERQINQLKQENEELQGNVQEYQQKDRQRIIHDHLRRAGQEAKVRDTAMEDLLLVGERVFDVDENNKVITKDGVGVTPGVDPVVWLSEVKSSRPHWWPESQGVGARGGDGKVDLSNNPFSADGWNMTAQGELIRQDRARAEQLAKAAGTSIGGPRPSK